MRLGKSKKDTAVALPVPRKQKARGHGALPRSPHFVLLIGDEGAILIFIHKRKVVSRHFVIDASAASMDEFAGVIRGQPTAGVTLIVDTIDQSYVQQTLPPVTSLSVGKLIKRRLDKEFAGEDIKGSISFGRDASGRKDWQFMMVALEQTPQVKAWLQFISGLPNRCRGIFLLPVETPAMLSRLEAAQFGVPKDKTVWHFLVSHNKVSGFRQVILKNGKIIFTRLGQPIAGDASPEAAAGVIEQEIHSTIEYMKRLSFSEGAGLTLTIIAGTEILSALDRGKFSASSYNPLTPHEAAELLGLEDATKPGDRYGDVVMGVTIGTARKPVMPLYTPAIKKKIRLFQFLLTQRVIGALILCGLLGYGMMQVWTIFVANGEINTLRVRKSEETGKLDQLKKNASEAEADVDLVSDVVTLHELFVKDSPSPLLVLQRVSSVLAAHPGVRAKTVLWEYANQGASGGAAAAAAQVTPGDAQPMNVRIQLEIHPTTQDNKALKALSEQILADIKAQFPGRDVKYENVTGIVQESDRLEVNIGGENTPAQAAKPITALLIIQGPMLTQEELDKLKADAAASPQAPPIMPPMPTQGVAP